MNLRTREAITKSMPLEQEVILLRSTLERVRSLPFPYKVYASLVTGESGKYRLHFAYSLGDDADAGVWGYCGAETPSPWQKSSLAASEIIREEGCVWFRGSEFLGTRDPQDNELRQPFVAKHGYQELTGPIRSTFLELHMILQLVPNAEKSHSPTLYWLASMPPRSWSHLSQRELLEFRLLEGHGLD